MRRAFHFASQIPRWEGALSRNISLIHQARQRFHTKVGRCGAACALPCKSPPVVSGILIESLQYVLHRPTPVRRASNHGFALHVAEVLTRCRFRSACFL